MKFLVNDSACLDTINGMLDELSLVNSREEGKSDTNTNQSGQQQDSPGAVQGNVVQQLADTPAPSLSEPAQN